MARRRKVMGLPIGKKKPAVGRRMLLAAGAGLAAVPGVVAAVRKAAPLVSSGRESAEKLSDVAAKAGQLKDAIGGHTTSIGKLGAAVSELGHLGNNDGATPRLSHLIEEHKEIAVPRRVAYDQWTQFEMFPSIVKGAERVEQRQRDRTSWTSKIGPVKRQWTAEITEQVPDERIAWKATGGLQMKGVVTFHSLDEDLTRVLVQIEYSPRGTVEQVANLLRVQRRRVRRDLRLFKHFLELHGEATGAWRQRIAKKDNSRSKGRPSSNGTSNRSNRRSSQSRTGGSDRRERKKASSGASS